MVHVVRNKSLTILEKVISFQQVCKGILFVQFRCICAELRTKKRDGSSSRKRREVQLLHGMRFIRE